MNEPKPTYAGPIRKTPALTPATHCHGCGRRLPIPASRRGEWWCQPCKDPDGYLFRLKEAQAEARQRCLAAYPQVTYRAGDLFEDAGHDA